MFLITGLEPFTEYDLQVAGVNQYTSTMIDIFGPEIEVYTTEGGMTLVVCDHHWSCDYRVIWWLLHVIIVGHVIVMWFNDYCVCEIIVDHVIVVIWWLSWFDDCHVWYCQLCFDDCFVWSLLVMWLSCDLMTIVCDRCQSCDLMTIVCEHCWSCDVMWFDNWGMWRCQCIECMLKLHLTIWAASLFLVPLQVELQTITYSPHHIYIFWEKLNQTALRGNVSDQEFIVHILGNTTRQRSTSMEVGGLEPGTQVTFKVWVWVMWPSHDHSSWLCILTCSHAGSG